MFLIHRLFLIYGNFSYNIFKYYNIYNLTRHKTYFEINLYISCNAFTLSQCFFFPQVNALLRNTANFKI